MPWCDTCDVYRAPSAVSAEGRCPDCGNRVDPGELKRERRAEASRTARDDGSDVPPIPWHFWVLVGGVIVYLAWRFIQMIGWIAS